MKRRTHSETELLLVVAVLAVVAMVAAAALSPNPRPSTVPS